ncbi:MAG: SUMF1/EgtB/PvdO family nonheme iron enzyme [Gammaproteobacteria bacterium]
MIAPELLDELRLAQDLVTGLAESLDEDSFRQQFHPDLSALGWHLGHCTFTECYWLQEVIRGDDRYTAPVADLYTPPRTPKPERGQRIPPLPALLQWVQAMQSENIDTLAHATPALLDHALLQDNYLIHFLIQHYSQHFESMLMALTQREIARATPDFVVTGPLQPNMPAPDSVSVAAGYYRVGGQPPVACDNELPAQQAILGPYRIARHPVTNSEYLAFMDAGGYTTPALWSTTGRDWLEQAGVDAPQHWRRDDAGHWYGIGVRGAYALAGDDILHGISLHEATAYANWAGGRLPHEHQWEVACRLQLLEQTGRAWEWCSNCFYPYAGFQAFPYAEFSQPWFDDNHYTLRGGSFHTRPALRHASFRNFYEPDKRHIFAGLRLVY